MSNEAGVTKEERDFISEVIAEDKQRRTPRNYVTAVAKPAFDEEAERAKFEKHYASINEGFCPSAYEGEYDWADCQPCWLTWLACAKSREESK